ncbi:M55 family metallopeptidase [Eubacteriales bacterium OttesenSCG-928-M02]|nr:M55 family metallopeptidase [Eubacteriales bacterium OttesenSCG-928-M02]
MRIYISMDAEGCTGLTSFDQVQPGHFRYQEGIFAMAQDLEAVLEGAREAGATEFVICDAHNDGMNLLLSPLGEDVKVVRGTGHPLSMMGGIDSAIFDGAIFLGYHGKKGSAGVMAHTYYPDTVEKAFVGELEVGEFGLNAYVAGAFDVPAIMISGDDVMAAEAREVAPLIDCCVTKEALGNGCALCEDMERTRLELHACAKLAVLEAKTARPSKPEIPEITICFTTAEKADIAAKYGQKITDKNVLFTSESYLNSFRNCIQGMQAADEK